MWPVSNTFLSTIKTNHKDVITVDVYSGDTRLPIDLNIIEGNVRVRDEAVRRQCNIVVVDATGTLSPAAASDYLAPFGNELIIKRGIQYSDGTTELVPLGVFGISDVKIDDSGESLQINIDGYDRARKVSRARFTNEYAIASGTNYVEAIRDLISSRYSAASFRTDFGSGVITATTPLLVFQLGDDPWEKARDMAESIGAELYFDANGDIALLPVTDPATAPTTVQYAEGSEATFLYVNKRVNDEQTYNHVVVTGEAAEGAAPVRAEAIDDVGTTTSSVYYLNDAASATKASGSYGRVVYTRSSQFIKTTAQALAAAQLQLFKSIGVYEEVRFNAIVNPAHDINDVIQIVKARSRINARYVLDSVTIPLVHGRAMDINTRKRRV